MDNFEFELIEDGETKQYTALAFLEVEGTKYMIYGLKSDINGDNYIARYEVNGEDVEVIPVQDQEEWDKVTKFFKGEN